MQLHQLLAVLFALATCSLAQVSHQVEVHADGYQPNNVIVAAGDFIFFAFYVGGHALQEGTNCALTPGGINSGPRSAGQTYVPQITDTRTRRFFCPFHCGETFIVNQRFDKARDIAAEEADQIE
ncbi:hypothetical protein B0T16DRAFT_83680 [Cercophora newfieldiana]|uniref:Uncharacterized protein n=1 Tax=Cercophora newfieldiana TaxID=92897 RepID=A0AA39YFD5_9PEZI|nr:hypothetical protein B0T16DRAFT_83680 [Cercophora newfieldiana]